MTREVTDGTSAVHAQELTDPSLADPPASAATTRAFNTRGRTLRGFAARGMMVNTAFNVFLTILTLVRGFLLAAFLTRADYGVWGVLGVSVGVLARLKVVGIGDKYMQQDDRDQELAFQQAFTMELLVSLVIMVPLLCILPLVAIVYGSWNIVGPGVVVLLVLPAGAFSSPLWIYYRHMEYGRARLLQAIDPIVGGAVALTLAIAGAGYWSLAFGVLAGAWTAAFAVVRKSPYRLRWRFHKDVARIYRSYSVPLFVTSGASVVLANSGTLAINAKLGLAGVGAVALASTITSFSTNVDDIVSGTLYSPICAVKDRLDLLKESFVKVNRLALMWAMPFGLGVALFSGDLVQFGLGARWRPAVGLLQITGIVAAVAHIGFNWDDYFRARADTRPIAVTSVGAALVFLAVGIPLTLRMGMIGLGIGIAAQALVALGCRAYYVTRMFDGFDFLSHAARAILPSVPAVAVVVGLRGVEGGTPTLRDAVSQLVAYLIVTGGVTWLLERSLLREALGYVLERRATSLMAADAA